MDSELLGEFEVKIGIISSPFLSAVNVDVVIELAK